VTTRLLMCLTGLLCALAQPCRADDPYHVIRQFGLLGTWSIDCADDTGATLNVRFAMTSLGLPRVIVGQPDVILYSSVIQSARLVGPDEVSLDLTPVLGVTARALTPRLRDGDLQYLEAASAAGVTGGGWSKLMRLCVSE
jgi:hypothetical protein